MTDESEAIRIVVADDSMLFRRGLCRLLEDAGLEVVGEAADPDRLLTVVDSESPDVAIVDIKMPPTFTDEGLKAANALRRRHPGLGVLVLSQYLEVHYAVTLLEDKTRGAGYLLKDRVTAVEEFIDAVRRVSQGGFVIDTELVAELLARRRTRTPLNDLTDREREVLSHMAEGRSNQAIQERLFISSRTVETHVRNILTKLGIEAAPGDNRRVLAVLAYLRS
jgi:DNA-binding NarL/FixJ family response regulator